MGTSDWLELCRNRECERFGQRTTRKGYGGCELCGVYVETYRPAHHCETCRCDFYENGMGQRLETELPGFPNSMAKRRREAKQREKRKLKQQKLRLTADERARRREERANDEALHELD
jgi:hypothetical protein